MASEGLLMWLSTKALLTFRRVLAISALAGSFRPSRSIIESTTRRIASRLSS